PSVSIPYELNNWRRNTLIVVAAVAVAAVVGHAKPPPDGQTATAEVDVLAVQPQQLDAAAPPRLAVPPLGGAALFSPPGHLGPGRFLATADSEQAAIVTALGAARSYVVSLVDAQDRWLARAGPGNSLRSERARRQLLREPDRYMILYQPPAAATPTGG